MRGKTPISEICGSPLTRIESSGSAGRPASLPQGERVGSSLAFTPQILIISQSTMMASTGNGRLAVNVMMAFSPAFL
jgi:hypothetical protein